MTVLLLTMGIPYRGFPQIKPSRSIPLVRAHAHNDYEHDRPLLDALNHGFCSVEADIFLVDGKLLVGHDSWNLKPDRTLKKLYLEPLFERVQKNAGRVYPNGPRFTLLIDFKSHGEETYRVLKQQLKDYHPMLCGMENGSYQSRAIQIVISGDCPRKAIANDQQRRVAIDGRLSDLDSEFPAHLMPLISDRWGSHFKWRGQSPLKRETKQKLRKIVQKAHAAGRRVRFWGTPESAVVWDALVDADIDHINTDQLEKLQAYLLQSKSAGPTNQRPGGRIP